jgi:hypothetical protein
MGVFFREHTGAQKIMVSLPDSFIGVYYGKLDE